jgi:hypothetical protein
MRAKLLILVTLPLAFAFEAPAGSATWAQTPADNNWSNPSNWMPNTVPNSTTDLASFDASSITDISLIDSIVQGLAFDAGASACTLTHAVSFFPAVSAPSTRPHSQPSGPLSKLRINLRRVRLD